MGSPAPAHRRRSVRVDLDEVRRGLDVPSGEDLSVWRQIRSQLQRRVGEDMFAIWLEPVELIAIDSHQLVVSAPAPTAEWTNKRFGRPLAASASDLGRALRFASEAERHAVGGCAHRGHIAINQEEAAG